MDAVAYALANNVLAGVIGPEGQTAKTALPATRYIHSQSTLSDGKVLVTGGVAMIGTVYSYNPATNAWTTKTALPAQRWDHGQSTLSDGTVLVTGNGAGSYSADVQSYDPGGIFTPTPGRAALLGYLAAT